MASQWVGVIGTGIGAGIGGVVTVVSLIVKGRQDQDTDRRRVEREDQVREHDRFWALKLQNVEDRRRHYARLLASAQEVVRETSRITHSSSDANKRYDTYVASPIDDLIRDYREIVAETYLLAVDPPVSELAESIASIADDLTWDFSWEKAPIKDVLAKTKRLENDVLPTLREACRRDLGLGLDSPGRGETP